MPADSGGSLTALANLAEICVADSIDGISVGLADSATPMDHRERPRRTDVQVAIEHVMQTIVVS